MFTNLNGDPVSPGGHARFQRLLAGHRLPPVRLRDLRRGAATLALAAGGGVIGLETLTAGAVEEV